MTAPHTWIIGADPDCDVIVDLPTVSGRHCRLTLSPAGFLLEDLQSTNGTYVNGQAVTRPVRVTRTDVILLGSKVALPWPDLSAGPPAEVAILSITRLSPKTDRRQVIGALCGVGLALALVLYAFIDGGSPKHGGPSANAGTPGGDSSAVDRQANAASTGSTRAENQPPATAETVGVSNTKPPAVPDLETAVKAQERNVVWVGYRLRDFAFPYASGWLVRPDRVVTTATVIADLEPLSKDGIEPIVWRAGQIVAVKALRRHPAFDAENPGSQASTHANVGLLELEQPLDANCPVASADELAALSGAQSLLAVGFESTLGENEPFDELKVKRMRHKTELLSSEVLASRSSRLYKLRAPTGKGWEGAPVFNERGHVVGVLGVIAGEARMVPVSQLAPLLEAGGGKR